jgi:hypothetical protein
VGDLLAQVGLGNLLHLAEDDGRDFFGSELLGRAVNFDLNDGLAILLNNLVREMLEVALEGLLVPLSADKPSVTGIVVSEPIYR